MLTEALPDPGLSVNFKIKVPVVFGGQRVVTWVTRILILILAQLLSGRSSSCPQTEPRRPRPLVGLRPLIFIQAYRKKGGQPIENTSDGIEPRVSGAFVQQTAWAEHPLGGGVAASSERLRSGVLLKFACYVIKWGARAEYKSAN